MSAVKVSTNQRSSKSDDELEGLSDGGHNIIACSNCGARLMDLWVTRPHEADEYRVRASCPWCGDRSFVVKIKGGFHQGGAGTPNGDDDTVESTCVDGYEMKDGIFEFNVIKAGKDAQPIYR